MNSLKQALSDGLEALSPKIWLDLNILRRNRNFGPEYWLLPRLCQKTRVSLDVGGNRGWFAYYIARHSRQVHVFEPNPICQAQVTRLQTRNMTLHKVGLSDKAGEASMRFDPSNTGIGTIESKNTLTGNPGVGALVELKVPVKTLDDFGFTDVAFIKIDVEGHEPAVLRGGRALLAANHPVLLMELELRHNPSAFEEVRAVLDPLGYRMKACTQDGLVAVDRTQIASLQTGTPETNPGYINNFVFAPPDRPEL